MGSQPWLGVYNIGWHSFSIRSSFFFSLAGLRLICDHYTVFLSFILFRDLIRSFFYFTSCNLFDTGLDVCFLHPSIYFYLKPRALIRIKIRYIEKMRSSTLLTLLCAVASSIVVVAFPYPGVSNIHFEVLALRASTTVNPAAVTGTTCTNEGSVPHALPSTLPRRKKSKKGKDWLLQTYTEI